MKHGRLFYIAPIVWTLCGALLIVCGVTWFLEPIVAYIELAVCAVIILLVLLHFLWEQRRIDRYMRRVLRHINEQDERSLYSSPLPIVVLTDQGQIVWHNTNFEMQVTDNHSVIGKSADLLLSVSDYKQLYQMKTLETNVGERHFRVFVSPLSARGHDMFVLYFLDITELHDVSLEYAATRPVALMIQIDNLDEVMQKLRDSERARIAGEVENALENWFANTTAVLRKFDDDRFFALVEKRFLPAMIDSRFDILDRVKAIPVENNARITLAIGVGEGEDFRAAQEEAKLALDMALGRGGDQAAVRVKNGFEFYGGQSKDIEKRTKVRTRVMAAALQDLIEASENVLIMGHRFSDLDCVGSAVTLAGISRALGRPAHVIVSRSTSLAEELLTRYDECGKGDLFVEPTDALTMIRQKTLLIITDTQVPQMLESFPAYERATTVAIIDHHRKSANHCDKAVLFYHESFASSACEMVAELVQYMNVSGLAPLDAEALLAGIMLDTRNFVLKAGVRTFEAAAYLRKQGADTVSVKKIFSGSFELYQQKSELISAAVFYKNTAISCAQCSGGSTLRIACSQAADELLSIKDVDASFTLFEDAACINISARSFGEFNVQLVMEELGGGGHLTMAGAQLKSVSMDEAVSRLQAAIDHYLSNT